MTTSAAAGGAYDDVTISIVSHGHGQLLAGLLRQLDACSAGTAGYPVVLTLNRADESFDPGAYPGLRLKVIRNDAPRGFGANHNAAFAQCRTRWFAVLNPDLRLLEFDPFPSLVGLGSEGDRIGVVVPRIVDGSGRPEDAVRANLTPLSLLRRSLLGRRAPAPMQDLVRRGTPFRWFAGMFLLVNAQAYRELGGFDERYFLYCEDYDLCARLYLAGYGLVRDEGSSVRHDAQRDSHRSSQHLRWHVGGLLKVWGSGAFWRVTLGLS